MSSNPSAYFNPLFTREQVFAQEASHNETWGVSRRMNMMTLAKSVEELRSICDNPELLSAITQNITDYRAYLSASIELADAAIARLLIADSSRKELNHA